MTYSNFTLMCHVLHRAYNDMYYLIDKYAPFQPGIGPSRLRDSERVSLANNPDHTEGLGRSSPVNDCIEREDEAISVDFCNKQETLSLSRKGETASALKLV